MRSGRRAGNTRSGFIPFSVPIIKSTNRKVGAFYYSYYFERDSKPEGARSVKQNSLNNCFVAEWCEGGYCEQCGAVAEQEIREADLSLSACQ